MQTGINPTGCGTGHSSKETPAPYAAIYQITLSKKNATDGRIIKWLAVITAMFQLLH